MTSKALAYLRAHIGMVEIHLYVTDEIPETVEVMYHGITEGPRRPTNPSIAAALRKVADQLETEDR